MPLGQQGRIPSQWNCAPPFTGRGPSRNTHLPRPALLWALWAALRAGAGVGTGTSWTGVYQGKPRELSPAIYGGEGTY